MEYFLAVYKYYAIIFKEDGNYIVEFPDLENVFTYAETLPQAVQYAEEVLGLMLTSNEADGIPFNPPSPADKIRLPGEASLVLIEVDTDTFEIETY